MTQQPEAPLQRQAHPAPQRWVLWMTVGVLIAAALLGGFFIIAGDRANIAGSVWTTFMLVVLFAAAVALDANLDGPNRWYMSVSTMANVVILIVGLLKIWTSWLQTRPVPDYDYGIDATTQFFRFLAVALLLRLALLVTQLGWIHFVMRARRQVTRVATMAVLALVWLTALVLAVPASFPGPHWPGWWWRMSGATVLAAVILAVIPVVFRAFEPKPPRPQQATWLPPAPQSDPSQQGWNTSQGWNTPQPPHPGQSMPQPPHPGQSMPQPPTQPPVPQPQPLPRPPTQGQGWSGQWPPPSGTSSTEG